jgi:hypothetical protein
VEPRREGRTAAPWFELDCSSEALENPHCEGRSGRLIVWGALGSRSTVIFDLDDDGDLDIVTNDFNSEPMVLISNLTERKEVRFLKVKLIGTESNRSGLGATVIVQAGSHTYTPGSMTGDPATFPRASTPSISAWATPSPSIGSRCTGPPDETRSSPAPSASTRSWRYRSGRECLSKCLVS